MQGPNYSTLAGNMKVHHVGPMESVTVPEKAASSSPREVETTSIFWKVATDAAGYAFAFTLGLEGLVQKGIEWVHSWNPIPGANGELIFADRASDLEEARQEGGLFASSKSYLNEASERAREVHSSCLVELEQLCEETVEGGCREYEEGSCFSQAYEYCSDEGKRECAAIVESECNSVLEAGAKSIGRESAESFLSSLDLDQLTGDCEGSPVCALDTHLAEECLISGEEACLSAGKAVGEEIIPLIWADLLTTPDLESMSSSLANETDTVCDSPIPLEEIDAMCDLFLEGPVNGTSTDALDGFCMETVNVSQPILSNEWGGEMCDLTPSLNESLLGNCSITDEKLALVGTSWFASVPSFLGSALPKIGSAVVLNLADYSLYNWLSKYTSKSQQKERNLLWAISKVAVVAGVAGASQGVALATGLDCGFGLTELATTMAVSQVCGAGLRMAYDAVAV